MKKMSLVALLFVFLLGACGSGGEFKGKTFDVDIMGSKDTLVFENNGTVKPKDDSKNEKMKYEFKDKTLSLTDDKGTEMNIEVEKKEEGYYEGKIVKMVIDGKEKDEELKTLNEHKKNIVTFKEVK